MVVGCKPTHELCLGLFGLLKAPASPTSRLLVLLFHLLHRLEDGCIFEDVGQYYELDMASPQVYLLQLAHATVSPCHRHCRKGGEGSSDLHDAGIKMRYDCVTVLHQVRVLEYGRCWYLVPVPIRRSARAKDQRLRNKPRRLKL